MIEKSRRRHVAALLATLIPARRPPASVEAMNHRSGPSPEGDWVESARIGLAMLDNWQVEREAMERQLALLERRASTAEQWAGVLAEEIRRKEADLVDAHAALAKLRQANWTMRARGWLRRLDAAISSRRGPRPHRDRSAGKGT